MQHYLRFHDLCERGVVRNRTTLSRWIRERGFPPGVKLGENSRAWPENEVEEWVEAQRQKVEA